MLQYHYPHFQRRSLIRDAIFRGGPAPGEQMPDFEPPTTDGRVIRKEDLLGHRPVLFTVGSVTCPMTAVSSDILKKLHRKYGDRIQFVTIYVREAHPGDRFPQARTIEEKMEYGRAYQERDAIPWTIAVDDPDGTLHRALDPKPNSAYVMAPDGTISYRTLWTNDEGALEKGLRAAVEEPPGNAGQTQSHVVPMLSGVGRMYEMLQMSGPTARRDVMKQVPPMYLMARLASVFRPLPPLGRGIAATMAMGLGMMVLLRGMQRLRRR